MALGALRLGERVVAVAVAVVLALGREAVPVGVGRVQVGDGEGLGVGVWDQVDVGVGVREAVRDQVVAEGEYEAVEPEAVRDGAVGLALQEPVPLALHVLERRRLRV